MTNALLHTFRMGLILHINVTYGAQWEYMGVLLHIEIRYTYIDTWQPKYVDI